MIMRQAGRSVDLAVLDLVGTTIHDHSAVETERILHGDRSYGMGCAVWATLAGTASLAVCLAPAFTVAR
jgi:hypothetical protein